MILLDTDHLSVLQIPEGQRTLMLGGGRGEDYIVFGLDQFAFGHFRNQRQPHIERHV